MDLNRAAVFVTVVEQGSFTRAARTLGVPTSSVSRSVAALEGELDVQLLQRSTRTLTLTAAGSAFFERSREALSLFDGAAEAARNDKRPSGLVRLTAPAEAGGFLARTLIAFRRRYPAIRVEVVLTSRFVDLVAEGIDIALRVGTIEQPSLVTRRVASTSLGLFASPQYLRERGAPGSLAELTEHDCIVLRGKSGRRSWDLKGPRGEERVQVQGVLLADGMGFVLEATLAGAGIALLPIPGPHDPLLHAPGLVRVLPDYATDPADFAVVVTSRHLPARVALLRDELVRAFGEAQSEALTLCPEHAGQPLGHTLRAALEPATTPAAPARQTV